jgi:hypothetical protein
MTHPKQYTSIGKEKDTKLTKLIKQGEFPTEIENPKRLTLAEKGKAKVDEYAEYPAENLQKFPQQI